MRNEIVFANEYAQKHFDPKGHSARSDTHDASVDEKFFFRSAIDSCFLWRLRAKKLMRKS